MNSRDLVKKVIPKKTFKQVEPYGHWAEAVIAQSRFMFPARKLKVVGVTGTDGKTTTATMIAGMLRNSGKKTAMITTASVDYGDGRGEQPNPTTLTTGNVFKLLKIIQKIADSKVEWLVLEVSSHALIQRRVWGIPFTVVVHTNMSSEHLDYHGTFENYRRAKEILFKLCNNNKKGLRTGLINADDATATYFKRDIQNPVMYGMKHGELRATGITSSLNGNTFTAVFKDDSYHIQSPLIGAFNVYNALAAVGVGRAVGLTQQQIENGIAATTSVPGRMMPIAGGQNFHVLIDFAVTPGALENVLKTAKGLTKGSIHIVFGATGDRDKTKRAAMGKVTAELADYVYLTDDETYTEDPVSIRAAVMKGVPKMFQSNVTEFDDRKQAISAALQKAKKDDVVIISGMGHMTTRNMGGKKTSWSDIEVTKELLKK